MLHRIEAPAALPALRDDLRHRLGSPLVPEDVRRRALERLEQLPDGDRLLHGDFHPANLLRTAERLRRDRLDERDARRSGSRCCPVDPPRRRRQAADDAPTVLRLVAPFARRVLVAGYLRAYARELPLDRERVDRWLPVWAAARLAEDIEPEREFLLERAR